MAKNPISVGGINKLLNKINEEVTQAAVKAAKREGEEFEVNGAIKISGNFGFDNEGELGFVGNVISSTSVGGDVGIDLEREWNSDGDGQLALSFNVKVSRATAR